MRTWHDKTFLFFGGSYGAIQEHLLPNYKNKTNYLKSKDPVTDSSKINPDKVLGVIISE